MTLPRILVIDDQYAGSPSEQELVKETFALRGDETGSPPQLGHAVFFSGLSAGKFDVEASLKEVERGWKDDAGSARWALVVVDYYFVEPLSKKGVEGGKHIVQAIKARYPEVPVVLFSTKDPQAVEKNIVDGVAFLQKPKLRGQKPVPEVQADLRRKFFRILAQHGLFHDETVRYVDHAGDIRLIESARRPMVGSSLPFLRTLRNARASLLNKPFASLLLQGAEGSGKDVLVQYVHDWGEAVERSRSREDGYKTGAKLESFHVGEIAESEMTQVSTAKLKERLSAPNGGTLHFDAIECLPAPSQRFLARWIEERMGTSVEEACAAPSRLIFTSSQPVQQLLESNQLVSSLADQLDVIEIPDVFDRRGALELLDYFLKDVCASKATTDLDAGPGELSVLRTDSMPPALDPDARNVVVRERNWPGNVRQVRRLAWFLAARNEFRRTVSAQEVRTCIAKTSSLRIAGSRTGVRGLIDRMAEQAIGENERLDGVFKELRSAGSKLVKRLLLMEAIRQRYTRQRVARILLDDDSIENWGSFRKLNDWRVFFEIEETGDERLDAMLAKPEKGGTRPK